MCRLDTEYLEPSRHPEPSIELPCDLFQAVCAVCTQTPHAKHRMAPTPLNELILPPFAEGAILNLTQCRALTHREREVLTLCCAGAKNSVIAHSLGISASAVRRHLRNLHRKTNTSDKAELILNLWHSCAVDLIAGERPTQLSGPCTHE